MISITQQRSCGHTACRQIPGGLKQQGILKQVNNDCTGCLAPHALDASEYNTHARLTLLTYRLQVINFQHTAVPCSSAWWHMMQIVYIVYLFFVSPATLSLPLLLSGLWHWQSSSYFTCWLFPWHLF